MTPTELAADLRTRINPLYATQIGTESYERRLCAEAIEGLPATVAERDAEIERRKGTLQDVRGHYERVCKERDALKADAERYRWLREQDDTSPLFCMYGSNGPWGECGHSDIYGDLLDTSIDKELKGTS